MMMTTRSEAQRDARFLCATQLADRYNGRISVKTLANWRSTGTGPAYTKIGGRVFYALQDVEKWELQRQITPRVSR
jgi:hypothetical protein